MRSNFIYLTQAQAPPPLPSHPSRILLAFPDSSHEPIYTPSRREIMLRVKYSILLNPLTPKIRLLILPFSCYPFPCEQITRIWH